MIHKKVLVLGASEMQLPIIMRAKELGCYVIVADYNPNASGFQYADEKLFVSTNEVSVLLKHSKEKKIDGVLTTSDFPVNSVAYISKEMGLNAMSIEVADICTNKYKQRQILKKNNINVPFFKLCECIEDLNDLIHFPYIVKPIDSSASRGVKMVTDKSMLQKAYEDALNFSQRKKVIVEEFIDGREFSVETLTQNRQTYIINITEKLTRGKNIGYFVEDTHIEPADISLLEKDLICNVVLNSVASIGLNNCPSHTEVKLNDKGCFVIEIACRLGGDYITSDLVPLSTGIDMLENLIKLSLGLKVDIKPKINKCSAVQFLNTDNYNKCSEFVQSNHPSMRRYEIKPFRNEYIKSSLDRLGYVILQTDTRKDMNCLLKKIQ
jgi:carbamoyl-phosphate synthase large subunit